MSGAKGTRFHRSGASFARWSCLCGLYWLLQTAFAPAFAADAAIAVAARIEETGAFTRLSFDLSRSVEPSAFVLNDPQRVVIDLPEINFAIDPPASNRNPSAAKSASGSLIKTYRFGLLGKGRSRIVIDLNRPAKIVRAESARIGQGESARLIIELAASDIAAFQQAALAGAHSQPQQQTTPEPQVSREEAIDIKPMVVIDPGHGGLDAGATGSSGGIEKTIVFDFAKTLAGKLEASGKYRVILTRNDDHFVALGDRVQLARDNHAALFISIHADTLAATQKVTGATIYTLAEKASDAESARIADKENQVDALAGIVPSADVGGINDILYDLTRRETRAYSHLFARTLVGVWQSAGRLNKNPLRAAGFRVLRAPDVPSVLVELGYLSSERDTSELISAQWRDKTADMLSQSIGQFFAARLNEGPNGEVVPNVANK